MLDFAEYLFYNSKITMENLDEKCPNLEGCPFLKLYRGNLEVISKGWEKSFCENTFKSKYCARKQFYETKNEPPPTNLTPLGTYLHLPDMDESSAT